MYLNKYCLILRKVNHREGGDLALFAQPLDCRAAAAFLCNMILDYVHGKALGLVKFSKSVASESGDR
jgi:hypothetical protein